MKTLEVEFVKNCDQRGDHKFVQIKRNEFAALYRRFLLDGTPLEYEVFAIKEAGDAEIFGRYYEKYEQYPGANAFGRTAWATIKLAIAEQIFDEITKGKGKRNQGVEIEAPVVKINRNGGKPGRPKATRPDLTFPNKPFCMKDLVKKNGTGWSQPTIYIELMKLVKADKVVETERKQLGRGRPVVFYKVKA